MKNQDWKIAWAIVPFIKHYTRWPMHVVGGTLLTVTITIGNDDDITIINFHIHLIKHTHQNEMLQLMG